MKKKIRIIAVCLFVLLFSVEKNLNAQDNTNAIDVLEWNSGFVILTTGDSISGAITYHCRGDVIEVTKEDNTINTFSPVNVSYFVVNNESTGEKQTFRTLYWDQGRVNSDFKKPTFFEQLNEGPLTLIMRETYIQRSTRLMSNSSPYGSKYAERTSTQGVFAEMVKPLYYILLPDGEIYTLKRVRKDLHRLIGSKSGQIKKFARKNKLSYEKPNELAAIINYYNSL